MKPTQTAKNAAKVGWDVFEELGNQTAKPIFDEAVSEIGSFFDTPRLGRAPKTVGHEDLQRAREEKRIEEMKNEETKKSRERLAAVRSEYHSFEQKTNSEQTEIKKEIVELQGEVVKLAKSAGVDTKVHLEQIPKKVGRLDIKRLTSIIRYLRLKADEAKSGKELVAQRKNAKRATGMLAWVSGKQMKVHEQGTLQLQG